jgi:hypothetical protein
MIRMAIVLAITVAAICVALFEIPSLWRKLLWKELWIFSTLLAFGTTLSIARALQAPIWNPTDLFFFAFKPMSESWIGMFK